MILGLDGKPINADYVERKFKTLEGKEISLPTYKMVPDLDSPESKVEHWEKVGRGAYRLNGRVIVVFNDDKSIRVTYDEKNDKYSDKDKYTTEFVHEMVFEFCQLIEMKIQDSEEKK